MPKSSRGRKPKSEARKESVGKTSKKPKCVKSRKVEKSSVKPKEGTRNSDSDTLEVIEPDLSNQPDIDEQLERNATRNNLSVFNVKSIIHHVLSDKRVVDMVCKVAEGGEGSGNKPILPDIEPKLTRARFREVSQTIGATNPLELVKEAIIHSPLKNIVSPLKKKLKSPGKSAVIVSEVEEPLPVKIPITEIKFSDGGSSDEEYVPLKDDWEESEEDSESNLSNTSDLASPEPLRRTSRVKRKLLCDPSITPPPPVKREKKNELDKPVEENSIVSPFKVPFPVSTKASEQKQKDDLIASRTRSRLPLTDTSLESLEADFLLPDCSPDMYDIINLDELDSDDIYWHKWLSALTYEKAPPDSEETEDAEYNFMADDEKEEKEEYRNDRAVQISQKELSELFEEFLNEFGDEINEAELDTPETFTNVEETTVTESSDMTYEQRRCLIRQLQQHTQLLVQVHLLANEHTTLQEVAAACRNFLNELIELSESASTAHVYKQFGNTNAPSSVFSFVGLNEAARIISSNVSSGRQAITSKNTRKLVPIVPKGPGTTPVSPVEKDHPIPRAIVEILRFSPVFIYTGLLPATGFRANDAPTRSTKFLQAEDNLLVLGVDQFGPKWHLIQKHYLPTKTAKQIKIRRKNLCSTRAPDNVMKQFRDTGVIPNLPVSVNLKAADERNRVILPNNELVGESKENAKKKKRGRKKKTVKPDDIVAAKQPLHVLEKKAEIKEIVLLPNREISNKERNPITLEKSVKAITTISRPDAVSHVQPLPQNGSSMPGTVEKHVVSEVNSTDDRKSNDVRNEQGVSTAQNKDMIGLLSMKSSTNRNDVNDKESFEAEQSTSDDFKENLPSTRSENEIHEDTKTRDRAAAFAQSYLNNVKKCLEGDNTTYNAFLEVLLKSKCEKWSSAKLYKEVSAVLDKFPELVRDFVGFLEPHDATEVGVFMTNNEIIKARTFLKRLESHFQKNPSHFQKIIKVFTTYNPNEPKPMELYDAMLPLLKGQQVLIEEFNSFFGHLPPRLSDSDEFEEVELGSGSDIDVDDFEEITIPDLTTRANKKTHVKGKSVLARQSGKLNRKQTFYGTATKKGNKLKKQEAESSKTNIEEELSKSDKTEEFVKIDEEVLYPEEIHEDGEDRKDNKELRRTAEGSYDKKGEDSDGEYSGYLMNKEDENCELSHADQVSPTKKSDSEHSNVSSPASDCKFETGDEYLDHNPESQESHMTSTSESISDMSNEACDIPSTSRVDLVHSVDNSDLGRQRDSEDTAVTIKDTGRETRKIIEKPGVITDGENSGLNSNDLVDQSKDQPKETPSQFVGENEVNFDKEKTNIEPQRISANNLELDKDGKPLIVWTRDEDKKILQLYQNGRFSENIFTEIAKELGNRTSVQVEGRFRVLVGLLTAGNNGDSSSEEFGSDIDEESCEESEENISI